MIFTADDMYLLGEGTHFRLWEKLGAHAGKEGEKEGVHFAVWAPNAERVSVIGDFNNWNKNAHPLKASGNSGVWRGFAEGAGLGAKYKYHIASRQMGYRV